MTTITALLTNKAYGFPTRGAQRRIKAPILACIHITGNRRTAADPDRHQAARDERNYANRAGSNGPSAHYYVARDGWAIEAIDPAKYAAWSNGDVASPNTPTPASRRFSPCARRATTRTRRRGSSQAGQPAEAIPLGFRRRPSWRRRQHWDPSHISSAGSAELEVSSTRLTSPSRRAASTIPIRLSAWSLSLIREM